MEIGWKENEIFLRRAEMPVVSLLEMRPLRAARLLLHPQYCSRLADSTFLP